MTDKDYFAAASTMPTAPGGTHVAYVASAGAVYDSRASGMSVSYTDEQRQAVADAGKKP